MRLPVLLLSAVTVLAQPPATLTLAGDWLVRVALPGRPAGVRRGRGRLLAATCRSSVAEVAEQTEA